MKYIKLISNGKINLGLNVINKRKDGYHNLVTVMQEIDLNDEIILKDREKGIKIESNIDELPKGKDNLVYKAYELIKEYSKVERGVEIYIKKNIPLGAGLAGGSSNAAMVLKGLNILWDLKLSDEELEKIGAKIGADVPFCISGGTKIAKGIGNEFEYIKSYSNRDILLVNPNIHMSTKDVYSKIKLDRVDENRLDTLIENINKGQDREVGKNLYNNLEEVVFKEEYIIKKIKEDIMDSDSIGALMSGSGSTVFGLYEDEESLELGYKKMKEKYPDYLILKCKTI